MELISIEPGQAEELSEYLHPIWHEVYDGIELGGPEGVEYIFTTWVNADAIRTSMTDGYEFGYISDDGGRIGVYSFRIERDGSFYLGKLYLDSPFRGRGLGQKAIGMLENIARANGCSRMYLSVFFYNTNAIKAYRRAGFEPHYRCLRYLGNGIVQNDYFMRKDL